MHPLFCHNVAEDFSQLTLGFCHHFRTVFLLELEVLFDDFVVNGFLLQRIIKLSSNNVVEKHSELFSVALFAAQLHQNL
jgi:hypothetical protein